MNNDLISRSSLIEIGAARKIIEVVGNWNELPGIAKAACTRLGIAHKKLILDAPAVDPESLRPKGRWEWFEEWLPSTTEHPRECLDCGWQCGECKNALEDMVGGYWDNPDEKPDLNYCPNCGAKMMEG